MIIRNLGLTNYLSVYERMKTFTDQRNQNTPDELWITEHYPVFTQGLAGKSEHILVITDIPIIQTDRGGQITYHGPQQMVFYPLIDIKRNRLGPRTLVSLLEETTVKTLKIQHIDAYSKADAPGVYTDHNNVTYKIASLGLRIRKNCSYHGLSLNIDLDLTPFQWIDPCGYKGQKMINSKMLNPDISYASTIARFTQIFIDDYQNRIMQRIDVQ